MEEYSEKTEKTEKSEEALYSLYHSKQHGKTYAKDHSDQVRVKLGEHWETLGFVTRYYLPSDFNIHFIYHASYLDA